MTSKDNLSLELPSEKKPSFLFSLYMRVKNSFRGMNHVWLAFLIPFLVMALIYAAKRVWPIGNNSVLVLDLNGQYVYYFEAIRDILRGEQGILYSFERALGGEFLGIVAYYLASPFSVITALFPEGMITESLLLMLLLKCGLSGFNMCVYLHKSHPTKPINELIFSTAYALTSYAIVMQHNTMWFDCVLFFPLILLGVESLIKEGKYKLYVLTLAVSVFSNYYIGYMVCIGVAIYFFAAYAMMTEDERNPLGERNHFVKSLARIFIYSLVAVGMAMIIILPAYYSLQFGKSTFTNPDFAFEQRFDFLDLVAKLFPASYDTVRREGIPFVYSGVLTLIMTAVFFFVRAIPVRKKIGYGALVAIFVFSFNTSTIDIMWHGFQEPNWLNYRYSFMLCFFLIVMAYRAFEHIEAIDFRKVAAVGAALILLLFVIQKQDYENVDDLMVIWVSIGLIVAYMILLAGCKKKWLDGAVTTVLCVFMILELFYNGLADVVALGDDVKYSSRTSYRSFIDKWTPVADYVNEIDDSFFRTEKTGHRKTNDNFTLNINGLTNSTSTLNKNQIKLLKQLGYSSKSHWSKYLGGTPLTDSLLGVKYLLTESEEAINPLYGEVIYTDEKNGTMVYKNDYALSLGYMVSEKVDEVILDSYANTFERINRLVTAMLGEEETVELFKPYTNLEPELTNLELSYKSGHQEYSKKKKDSVGKLTWNFKAENDCEIYMHIPCNTSYANKYQLDILVNGEDLSEYFSNETYRILSIGMFEEGEEFQLDMKLLSDKVYFKNTDYYFYYLDKDLYREIMPKLQANGFEIEEHSDTHFVGEVTATSDKSTFLLTIPYDEGWKIYVDGELTESRETVTCLTAVDLTPGTHKIELKYSPWCVKYGVTISAISLGCFVLMAISEKVIASKQKEKAPETPDEADL